MKSQEGGHPHIIERDSWDDLNNLNEWYEDQEIEFHSARQKIEPGKTILKAFKIRAMPGKTLEPAARPPNPYISFDIVEGNSSYHFRVTFCYEKFKLLLKKIKI